MSRNPYIISAAAFVAVFFFGVAVFGVRANSYNYTQFALGDRSSGMGGVGIADSIASDAPYYNPAGLAQARHDSVSFMATLYGFRKYNVDSSFSTGEDLTVDAFEIIPATAGSVFLLGTNTAAAFSMFITEQGTVSEIQTHKERKHFFNFTSNDKTLWIGPSLGHQLNNRWRVGAGAYVTYRDSSEFDSMYWRDYHVAYSYSQQFYHYGLLGTLGAQYQLAEYWHIGAVLQTPSASLKGEGKIQAHQISADQDNPYDEMAYADGLESNNKIPAKLGIGTAYNRPKEWSVGMDVEYHFSTAYCSTEGDEEAGISSVHESRENTWEFNLGSEYYVRRQYPVRAGFFVSYSSAPDIELDEKSKSFDDTQAPQIDLYGLTFSVGKETERVNMNIGLNYIFGSGDAQGWDSNNPDDIHQTKVSASEKSIYLFFTTSYLL